LNERAFIVGKDRHLALVAISVQRLVGNGEVAQHAAKGLFQVLAGKGRLRRPIGKDSPFNKHRPVAEFGNRTQIVGGDQHHPALVTQLLQKRNDLLLGLDVHTGEGFVEQDNLPVLCQRAGQKDALSLTAREFSDLAVTVILHIDPAECLIDRVVISLFRAPQKTHVAIPAHHDDIFNQNREGPVDFFGLRHIGDEVLAQGVANRTVQNTDGAAGNRDEPHDCLEQG